MHSTGGFTPQSGVLSAGERWPRASIWTPGAGDLSRKGLPLGVRCSVRCWHLSTTQRRWCCCLLLGIWVSQAHSASACHKRTRRQLKHRYQLKTHLQPSFRGFPDDGSVHSASAQNVFDSKTQVPTQKHRYQLKTHLQYLFRGFPDDKN
jgi:hypothetical protein